MANDVRVGSQHDDGTFVPWKGFGLQKVYPVGPWILAGFSGSVQWALLHSMTFSDTSGIRQMASPYPLRSSHGGGGDVCGGRGLPLPTT